MRAFVLAIAVTIGSPAFAGEAADRTELIARIDDAVHAISTALDAHKLDDATAHTRAIREMLTRLAAHKGDDARAADVLAHYPKYADAVDDAIKQLGELEQKVHRTDGVAARCAKDDVELHKLLKRRTSRPDPDPAKDVEALATKADAYAATWTPVLADLATVDHDIANHVAESHLALTDGYWMAVSASVGTEAKTAAEAWTDEYEAVTTACSLLGLGQKHADLVPVLEALRARIAADQTSATQLVYDYNAWLAKVRTVKELALQGRTSLRDAICQASDGEVTSRVGTVANQLSQDLDERTTAIIAEGARLLKDKHASKAMADGLTKARAIAANIERDESKGRANPRLVATLAAIGKRRDQALVGSKCVAKDIELTCTAGACRTSCIRVTDGVCTIVEPVPEQEKSSGFARAQHELEALLAWYTRDKAELFTRVPALKRCEIPARATLDLSTDVVTYTTCSAVTEAQLGEPLGDVPSDI